MSLLAPIPPTVPAGMLTVNGKSVALARDREFSPGTLVVMSKGVKFLPSLVHWQVYGPAPSPLTLFH